jgi:hypothetical protein
MLVLDDPSACSSVSSVSASTSGSVAAGCPTSRSCASASARGSTLRCRASRRSLRPEPLLSFHVCTRQGRGTRSWNRVR